MGRTKEILALLRHQDVLLRHLYDKVTSLGSKVEKLEAMRNRADEQIDRMCDRLLEMTLIQKGKESEAVAIRRLAPEPINEDWGATVQEDDSWMTVP